MRGPRNLLLLCAAGCAGFGTGDALDPLPVVARADANGDLRVDVGTGAFVYEPITNGAPVDVVAGPQGGFHIWTSVRVDDPLLEFVRIDLSARYANDGRPAGDAASFTAPLVVVAGVREHAGMTSFVTSPEAVQGRPLVLHAEVFAEDGRHGADDRTVLPR